MHYCPACREMHLLNIVAPTKTGSRWDWDRNIINPTFSPGARFKGYQGRRLVQRCHYHLVAGVLIFQNDCLHEFRGLKMDLPPVPDYLWERNVVRGN